MTGGDAMRGLFKAIGDYVRSTSPAANVNAAADNMQSALETLERQNLARFRRHADGTGFTIDGSRRPGDPTRPGEQNTGAFLGLQSGHALACLKAWADKAGMEFDESLGFEGNLTQWFIDQGNFREGR